MRQVTLLDDTQLFVHDAGEALSDAIVRERDYFEKEVLEYLSGEYPQHEVILDIGANIGNHTLYFSQYLEYRFMEAFEPILDNFILLRQNTRNVPNLLIRREAIGDSRGYIKMAKNLGNMGACEVRPDGTEVVQQIRVDDLFLQHPVTLMKIDVEWYEPQVLKGAFEVIEEDEPLILIEDAKEEYGSLLPKNYKLIKGWQHHKTYLYGV